MVEGRGPDVVDPGVLGPSRQPVVDSTPEFLRRGARVVSLLWRTSGPARRLFGKTALGDEAAPEIRANGPNFEADGRRAGLVGGERKGLEWSLEIGANEPNPGGRKAIANLFSGKGLRHIHHDRPR